MILSIKFKKDGKSFTCNKKFNFNILSNIKYNTLLSLNLIDNIISVILCFVLFYFTFINKTLFNKNTKIILIIAIIIKLIMNSYNIYNNMNIYSESHNINDNIEGCDNYVPVENQKPVNFNEFTKYELLTSNYVASWFIPFFTVILLGLIIY